VSTPLATPVLSVVLPLREPMPQLATFHKEAEREVSRLGVEHEFVYLTRRSDPRALAEVRQLQRTGSPNMRVLEFGSSADFSAMLGAGAKAARGKVLLLLPAAFEIRLDAIGRLYETLERGADLVLATRTAEGTKRASETQSRWFNRLVSWASGIEFRDIASSVRVLRREILDEIPLYGEFDRYLPLLAHRAGYRVIEVPAAPDPRAPLRPIHPLSTYFSRAMDLLAIFFISRFTRQPLRLFGAIGSVFGGVGAALLLVLGIQRILGEPLADRPALVLAVLLLGIGVQTFTIGLLGELILFFQARSIRDYRVAAVYGTDASHPGTGPDAS